MKPTLEELLAQHRYVGGGACQCGWQGNDFAIGHESHLASVLRESQQQTLPREPSEGAIRAGINAWRDHNQAPSMNQPPPEYIVDCACGFQLREADHREANRVARTHLLAFIGKAMYAVDASQGKEGKEE